MRSLAFVSGGGQLDRETLKQWDDHAQLIGHITILTKQLQSFVMQMFWLASGSGYHTAQTSFFSIKSDTGQREMTLAAVKERLDPAADEALYRRIRSTLSQIGSLSDESNAFIHSMWAMKMPDRRVAILPNVPPRPRQKPERIAERAEELIVRLSDLVLPTIALVRDLSDSASIKKIREHSETDHP